MAPFINVEEYGFRNFKFESSVRYENSIVTIKESFLDFIYLSICNSYWFIVLFSLLLYVEHFFFYFSHENLKPYDIPT